MGSIRREGIRTLVLVLLVLVLVLVLVLLTLVLLVLVLVVLVLVLIMALVLVLLVQGCRGLMSIAVGWSQGRCRLQAADALAQQGQAGQRAACVCLLADVWRAQAVLP